MGRGLALHRNQLDLDRTPRGRAEIGNAVRAGLWALSFGWPEKRPSASFHHASCRRKSSPTNGYVLSRTASEKSAPAAASLERWARRVVTPSSRMPPVPVLRAREPREDAITRGGPVIESHGFPVGLVAQGA